MPFSDSGPATDQRNSIEISIESSSGESADRNPYARGPDPTLASVAADVGPFATAERTVSTAAGFRGGVVYYPTDVRQTYGAVAIVPGYTALFADEEAWMGHWLASFGFVVIGVETNSRNDWDNSRGAQLLAALDYLTGSGDPAAAPGREGGAGPEAFRAVVDPNRLAVIGHSMGGGGAFHAATRRPSLKTTVGLAPYFPSGTLATVQMPTLIIGGQEDETITPSYLDSLYASLPPSTPSAYAMLDGADHLFATKPNQVEMRLLIPWLKIFVDNDVRYTPFLCPLADRSGVLRYQATCPLQPPG